MLAHSLLLSQRTHNTEMTEEVKKTPACKICCACPKERRARDECTIFKSLEECQVEIASFYKCLLTEGFSQADVDSLKKNVRT